MEEPLLIWDAGLPSRNDDQRGAELATPRVVNRIRRKLEGSVERSGGLRYLDDLAYHAIRLPFVHAVLPNAKVIHVIRDPYSAIPEMMYGWTLRDTFARAIRRRRRNVTISGLPGQVCRFLQNYVQSRTTGCRSTWGPHVRALNDLGPSAKPALLAAHQWMGMVQTCLDDAATLSDLNVLEVRFDRLIRSPANEVLRIARFAEAPSPDVMMAYARKQFRTDYVHHEQVQLEPTEEDLDMIRRTISGFADRMGFSSKPLVA